MKLMGVRIVTIFRRKVYKFYNVMIGIFIFPFIITSCSTTKSSKNFIEFNEDTKGPGFFSGNKGGFYLLREKKVPKIKVNQSYSKNMMSLKESSKELEIQIQRLQKDKVELEHLKQRIDRKLAE